MVKKGIVFFYPLTHFESDITQNISDTFNFRTSKKDTGKRRKRKKEETEVKKVLLVTILLLALTESASVQAKSKLTEFDLETHISSMLREHKLMANRLIAYMELKHESINLLAEVIYWENWHTDTDKRAAYLTGAVVMNRVKRDDSWLHLNGEKTVKGVLYARGQYSTTKYFFTKELPEECYEMARDIWENGTPDVPENVIFQATFSQGKLFEKVNGEWFCYG